MLFSLIVLALPITIIGANFDEESREQQRINERRRRADKRNVHVRSHAEECRRLRPWQGWLKAAASHTAQWGGVR